MTRPHLPRRNKTNPKRAPQHQAAAGGDDSDDDDVERALALVLAGVLAAVGGRESAARHFFFRDSGDARVRGCLCGLCCESVCALKPR